MALIFGGAFVLSLIAAYVFAMFLGSEMSLGAATAAGFAAGLCWVAASYGISYLFERRPLNPVADQRRLSHAAVHLVRLNHRLDAVAANGSGSVGRIGPRRQLLLPQADVEPFAELEAGAAIGAGVA